MVVTAMDMFDWLDGASGFSIETVEVTSSAFGDLRRGVRSILRTLHEGDDQGSRDLGDKLRVAMSGWLTGPAEFDHSIRESLRILGEPRDVQARWGADARGSYESALRAADEMARSENPLRKELRDRITAELELGGDFRIYCQRWARLAFQELLLGGVDAAIEDNRFLHSVSDYRDTSPFDVLFKVGPLRSRGWGALPDALVTAPRYCRLVHIVWEGCADDEGFGYDPVQSATGATNSSRLSPGLPVRHSRRHVGTIAGAPIAAPVEYSPDDDELRAFLSLQPNRERSRPSTLVHIDDVHGILFPRMARVLSYEASPNSDEPLKRRVPDESFIEGTFLVRPNIADVDFGEVQASHGYYSQLWKQRLMERLLSNEDALVRRLTDGGLDLLRLRSGIRNWLKPPTTVIRAPQKQRHFRSLIEALDLEFHWTLAWREVQRSRGIAIRTGVQEQEILEDELLSILKTMLDELRDLAAPGRSFLLALPEDCALQGSVMFEAVQAVEDDFCVPEGELKQVIELERAEQWRE